MLIKQDTGMILVVVVMGDARC